MPNAGRPGWRGCAPRWYALRAYALRASPTDYARANGGRFLIFGSAPRGGLRFDSDVDTPVDFKDAALSRA